MIKTWAILCLMPRPKKVEYRYAPNTVRLGLDLMTNTGWAVMMGGSALYGHGCVNLSADCYALRFKALTEFLDGIYGAYKREDGSSLIDEVVYEHAFAMQGPAAEIFSVYTTALRVWAYEKKIPAFTVDVSHVKMYIAGSGKAKKPEVIEAVNNRFGLSLNTGHGLNNHDSNTADAIAACVAAEKLALQGRLKPAK